MKIIYEIDCDDDGVHCGDCDWCVYSEHTGHCVLFLRDDDEETELECDPPYNPKRHAECLKATLS